MIERRGLMSIFATRIGFSHAVRICDHGGRDGLSACRTWGRCNYYLARESVADYVQKRGFDSYRRSVFIIAMPGARHQTQFSKKKMTFPHPVSTQTIQSADLSDYDVDRFCRRDYDFALLNNPFLLLPLVNRDWSYSPDYPISIDYRDCLQIPIRLGPSIVAFGQVYGRKRVVAISGRD